jgi:hypothetical protein
MGFMLNKGGRARQSLAAEKRDACFSGRISLWLAFMATLAGSAHGVERCQGIVLTALRSMLGW